MASVTVLAGMSGRDVDDRTALPPEEQGYGLVPGQSNSALAFPASRFAGVPANALPAKSSGQRLNQKQPPCIRCIKVRGDAMG